MALTSIGFQKTPARPVQITFAPNTNPPNPDQTLGIIAHMGPTGGAAVSGAASGSATPYVANAIGNVADPVSCALEVNAKFGAGSFLANAIIAAVNANFQEGNPNFPQIVAIPLAQTDVDFGPLNVAGIGAALAAADKFECEFIVSPYDGINSVLTGALKAQVTSMSGPSRVQNGQFGTFGVVFNRSVVDPTTLPKYDTQYLIPIWLRDTGSGANKPAYSLAQACAAIAAIMAGPVAPFNPLDGAVVGFLAAPASQNDWITVGAGLESEAALDNGWTPMRVLPTGEVAIVRSVTSRITTGDGVTQVLSYYDVQDFQVLYYFRKAVFTRFNQPDFVNVKASQQNATGAKNAVVQLASDFEDEGMFQAIATLAPLIQVQRNTVDRSRFDVFIPVNVVPGLHVIATNEQATTEGDTFTV